MAVWWRALLFSLVILTLSCLYPSCASPPSQQRAPSYRNFLSFTRGIRTRVQQLLRAYKEQKLGGFGDPNWELSFLPSLSTNFHSWLQVKEWERLNMASRDLHIYWAHLDQKIRQLGLERATQGSEHKSNTPPTLPERFERIQTDLSDLIKQVNYKLRRVNDSSASATSPSLTSTLPVSPPSSAQTPRPSEWTSLTEGYIVLRDLERYLLKLSRDFHLLASTQDNTPAKQSRAG